MEYAKLQLVDLRKPVWRLASMHARGAAVTILAFCADHETGGRVESAREWDQDTWRDLVGVRLIDVQRAVDAKLCWWDGDDLICGLYDQIGHTRLLVQREQGPHGAKGGRPRKTPVDNPTGNPPENPKGFSSETPRPPPDQSRPDQTTTTPDPRLATVAAAGGYLALRDGTDLTQRWIEAIGDLSESRITQVMEFGKSQRGEPVRVPFGDQSFTYWRKRVDQLDLEDTRRMTDETASEQRQREAADQQEQLAATSARLGMYVRNLDKDALDLLAERVAPDQAATTALNRLFRSEGRITELMIGKLRKLCPALDAIAASRTAEAL